MLSRQAVALLINLMLTYPMKYLRRPMPKTETYSRLPTISFVLFMAMKGRIPEA